MTTMISPTFASSIAISPVLSQARVVPARGLPLWEFPWTSGILDLGTPTMIDGWILDFGVPNNPTGDLLAFDFGGVAQ